MSCQLVISMCKPKWSHFSESLNSIFNVLEPRIHPFFKDFNVIPGFFFASPRFSVPSPSKVISLAAHFYKGECYLLNEIQGGQ